MKTPDLNHLHNFLNAMKGDKLRNYIVEGLTSSLVNKGKVRLFEANRHQLSSITPHSHTYDLFCIVLKGSVVNYEFSENDNPRVNADVFMISNIEKEAKFGSYTKSNDHTCAFEKRGYAYQAGESYHIPQGVIHSIEFAKDSSVLLFEGPELETRSQVIEPFVDGQVIETLVTKDWMFLPGINEKEEKS